MIAEVDKKTLKPTEWLNDKVIMMVIMWILRDNNKPFFAHTAVADCQISTNGLDSEVKQAMLRVAASRLAMPLEDHSFVAIPYNV